MSQDQDKSEVLVLDNLTTDDFLSVIGQRVRRQRTEKEMSRKRLAQVSGVSERYLAQLESGQGNMSIALLRKVTKAIGMSMGALMSEQITDAHGCERVVCKDDGSETQVTPLSCPELRTTPCASDPLQEDIVKL